MHRIKVKTRVSQLLFFDLGASKWNSTDTIPNLSFNDLFGVASLVKAILKHLLNLNVT